MHRSDAEAGVTPFQKKIYRHAMDRCPISMHAMSMEVGRSTCDRTVKQCHKVLVKGPICGGASEGNLARPALELGSAAVA